MFLSSSSRNFLRAGALAVSLLSGAVPSFAAGESGLGTFNTPDGLSSPSRQDPRGPDSRGFGMPSGTDALQGPPAPASTVRNANGNANAGDNSGAVQNRSQTSYPGRRSDLPPPRPSEFQKFVEAATGRQLQSFGSRFFTDAADSFSPVDNVPVSADYLVGPGDQLLIRAWGSIDVDFRATVDRAGQISLPKVGTFAVAGTKASNLESHLRAQIGRMFTNFSLNVTLGQLRGVKVFVVGPARVPGVYTLASQSSLLSAVVAAGGPSPNGSMRKVLLRRDGRTVAEIDIYDFLVNGDKSKDVQLAAGDTVVFQPAGPRVALTGAADTQAIFELKTKNEAVADLLRYAGDSSVLINPNRVQVERIDTGRPGAARFVEEFKLDEQGLKKTMQDGDILTLLPISPEFSNAVTLKGHVAQPLRYAYRPGMRIRDLIPDRDALISPDFYRRKNLLVQVYDEEREERAARANARRVRGIDDDLARRQENARNSTPDSSTRERRESGRDDRDDRGDRSARERDRQQDDERERTRALEREIDERARTANRKRPVTPLFDELNWDYAVIERLNKNDLTTQVIPFNLGKAVLQGDEANNLELQPGDVVSVYSQKDVRVPVSRQTRLVALHGEVAAPGTYQLMPGETLPQLIRRAGGLTPQAYLYGLDFSREETRQRQRENLTAAIARLESLSSIQAAREAANKRDDAASNAAAAVSTAATQAQIGRLTRMEPNGRIALELQPDVASLDELPNVPLEHQDQIVIPTRPAFVTVAGAVVNNNAFLWKPGKTVADYVKAAGLDEAAEPSNMFILRADGTVSHASASSGFFGRGLDSQRLNPGDAIVVPNKLDYETWGRALVRNLKDWSQIFSQFGLGAAAIITLRNN